MRYREFHYRWEFDMKADPESLWPFIADTNRFNRDAGVPQLELDSTNQRLRNARRRVRLSIYGMPVEWEEQPFEWVRPVRFGVERVYSKGPMARMRALAQFEPRPGGGTKLTYEIWAVPKNLSGMIAIPTQIKMSTAPKLRKAFERYDEMAVAGIDSEVGREFKAVEDLDDQRLAYLKEKLRSNYGDEERELSQKVIQKLIDHIEHRDDFTVSRIRPYQLADDWGESRRLVLETCLRATRVGLLDLQWDLVCPLCRGAKISAGSLSEIESGVHCSTCQIDFKVNFDQYVELTFRPNAAVRPLDVVEYCIGSPQRSPHVVVQQLLRPGESRTLSLPLGPGNYRARGLEVQGSQTLVVKEGGPDVAKVILAEQMSGPTLEANQQCGLQIENTTNREQLFILEKTEWSDQAATAAEVTSLQMFRDLFSREALRPGEQISVGTVTVLFTDLRHSTQLYREIGDATAFGHVMNHFDVLKKSIADHEGALVKTIGDAVMAVFRKPSGALLAMLDAQQRLSRPEDGSVPLSLKAGLHTGPCIAVTLNDRLDYFGSTVNMAARLEGLSSGTDVIVSEAVYLDAAVQRLLSEHTCDALEFRVPLKGFDQQEFLLWRMTRCESKENRAISTLKASL